MIQIQNYELKPNRKAFVIYKFLVHFTYSFIFISMLLLALSHVPSDLPLSSLISSHIFLSLVIAIFILWELFNYYSFNVRYKKERYLFLPEKIIYEGGDIFFDGGVELIIRNITHIKMELPYIEYKLFKTGNIYIEAAGSEATEIVLESIDNPKEVYNYIIELMKHNGFKLTRSRLIQQEKPNNLGVLLETLNFFGMWAILLIFGLLGWSLFSSSPPITIFIIIMIILSIASVFVYLDLKSRTYTLYSDAIVYKKEFLTKYYALLPIENLSDVTLTQTFIDKILGLYDIGISCQGSQQEIHFKDLTNGVELKHNIDNLIKNTKSTTQPLPSHKKDYGFKSDQEVKTGHGKTQTITHKEIPSNINTRFVTINLKIDYIRRLISLLPLIIILLVVLVFSITTPALTRIVPNNPMLYLIPALIFSVIGSVSKMIFTKYSIKERGVEEEYNFLFQKTLEFNNDKITSVVFKEDFIDKWFDTCSIYFYSIGSDKVIKFLNIKKVPNLYSIILTKLGMKERDAIYQMAPNFKITDMIKANFYTTIFFVFIIIFSLLLVPEVQILSQFFPLILLIVLLIIAAILFYKSIYYKKSKVVFYKNHIYYERGVLLREYYYTSYNNIKSVTTIKYPFSKSGSIKFNIAGEYSDDEGDVKVVKSNCFVIQYINDIDIKRELIDIILYYKPSANQVVHIKHNIKEYIPKTILSARPDLMNSLVSIVIISIILFPLIPLLIITVPLTILWVRSISYSIKTYKITAKSGIIYKKETSILLSNINHVIYTQGWLNKIFRNGNVIISTTETSLPELTIKNIPNFREFYNMLKGYYK